MSESATILYVPGTWHGPECFNRVITRLESANYKTDKVYLPSFHSYGGLPTNEAIHGLDIQIRQRNGLKGGVTRLLLCCSFFIAEGHSLISAFGENDLPWFRVSDDRLEANVATPKKIFCNDCDDTQIERSCASFRPHSYRTFHSPCTYAAWRDVPSTYLYCSQNAAIPFAMQKMMVEERARGHDFVTETVDASHSPFFSKPDEVAASIRRAVGEVI